MLNLRYFHFKNFFVFNFQYKGYIKARSIKVSLCIEFFSLFIYTYFPFTLVLHLSLVRKAASGKKKDLFSQYAQSKNYVTGSFKNFFCFEDFLYIHKITRNIGPFIFLLTFYRWNLKKLCSSSNIFLKIWSFWRLALSLRAGPKPNRVLSFHTDL